MNGWRALIFQWIKDLQLLVYIAVSLLLFRVVLIALFHAQLSPHSELGDILSALWVGFRFDLSTASKWVLVSFFASLGCLLFGWHAALLKLRYVIAYSYAVFGSILLVFDLSFFFAYGDHYNQLVFGLIYDDMAAVLATLWKEYHPLLQLLGIALIVSVNLRITRYWLAYTPERIHRYLDGVRHSGVKIATALLGGLAFVILARGGTLSGAPLSMKHAFVSADLFLNRSIPNPMLALWETLNTKYAMHSSTGYETFWPQKDLLDAAKVAFPDAAADDPANIQSLIETTVVTENIHKPQHIFFILMESHSGWPLFPNYRDIGLSDKLRQLADQGVYIQGFLPASSGTIGAVNAAVTGLPDTGLQLNYESAASKPLLTSAAEHFKRLGYQTRFFYGGLLGWQRLDSFVLAQGFEQIFGGSQMNAGGHMNEWGVNDEYLFQFVSKTLEDDRPSFNLILTTSNHPPYDLDLDKLGFPVKQLPADLHPSFPDTLRVLGHLWYADREMGRFVETMQAKNPRSLFAITGDHTARLKIQFPGDSVLEQVAVPLVLYGPQVLQDMVFPVGVVGSHIDILPTLYELSAPAGFKYYSVGTSLLHKQATDLGLGFQHIVSTHGIVQLNQAQHVYRYPGEQTADPVEIYNQALERYRAELALSWYMVRQGLTLPGTDPVVGSGQ